MAAPDSPSRADAAVRAPWIAGVVLLVALGAWWALRASERAASGDALAAYATAPLPSPGDPIDGVLADLGAEVFRARCAACHSVASEPHLGPGLRDVTARRDFGWIVAMVLAPDSMTRHDPVARALKEEHGVQMLVPGGVTRAEAIAVLEFLRRIEEGTAASAP